MKGAGPVRVRELPLLGLILVAVLTFLAGGCGDDGRSSASPRYVSSFEQPIVTEPPQPAPVPVVDPDQKSRTYATATVPEGWGIIGVEESISEVVLPSGVRTDRTRSVFYGPDRGRRIGFIITSMVQFSGDEVIDATFADCPASGYAAIWDCDGAIMTVESFDGTVDRASIQTGIYEIAESAFQTLVGDVGTPRIILGSDSGSIGGRRWQADATVPIETPMARGPGVIGCMGFVQPDDRSPDDGSLEPTCAFRPGPTSNVSVVQLDGRSFVLGVLTSSADAFVIRNMDSAHPATINAMVIISDVDPSLRWIVAPLDESMTECLTIESAGGQRIEVGDGEERSSLRVGIPHSVPYGYCTFGPDAPVELGPAVRWDAARSGTVSDLDGVGVVVAFIGAPEIRDRSDRCGATYVALGEESETEVIISVHPVMSQAITEGSEPFGCRAIGARRIAEVALVTPSGSRTVRDGSDGSLHKIFDGSTVLDPSWMPDGFSLTAEGAVTMAPSLDGWQRVWTRSETDLWERLPVCSPTTQFITITQTPDQPLPSLMPWEWLLPPATVKGRPVRVLAETSEENSFLRLDLTIGDRSLRLDGSSSCMGVPGPSLEDLLRVLDSTLH